ncbi:MAG: hypothetical protein JWM89_3692 [Acidimicrobiales bacterium]|nr:hypothetical protein [Acidimicrobiales bacterium]
MSTVLSPSTRSQRDRLVRLGVIIFVSSLPIAGVLLALVNWQVALGYIVVWTVGLMFGVRQQRTSTLRIDHAGLQYEAGTFVLRAAWSDIDRIGAVTLPDRKTEAFVLKPGTGALRWTQSPQVRQQVTSRGWDRIIPIDDFAPRWPAGALGDALREHRPDVLDRTDT